MEGVLSLGYGIGYCVLLSQCVWKRSNPEIAEILAHDWKGILAVGMVMECAIGIQWWGIHTGVVAQDTAYIVPFALFLIGIGSIAVFLYIVRTCDPYTVSVVHNLWPLMVLEGIKLTEILSTHRLPTPFWQAMVWGLGFTCGWGFRLLAFVAIRHHLSRESIPKRLDGLGISVIIAALMMMAAMGISGMVQIQ